MRSWSWSWVPWVSSSKGPLQPWEIQLLFWTHRIFSPQSHFESSNDLFLSPGCWEAAWGISCREGLWEWLLPGSTRVPAVRRRRRPLLLLPLVCYEKLRENDNWRNVSVLRCLSALSSCWQESVPQAVEREVQPQESQRGCRTMGIPCTTKSRTETCPGWRQCRHGVIPVQAGAGSSLLGWHSCHCRR